MLKIYLFIVFLYIKIVKCFDHHFYFDNSNQLSKFHEIKFENMVNDMENIVIERLFKESNIQTLTINTKEKIEESGFIACPSFNFYIANGELCFGSNPPMFVIKAHILGAKLADAGCSDFSSKPCRLKVGNRNLGKITAEVTCNSERDLVVRMEVCAPFGYITGACFDSEWITVSKNICPGVENIKDIKENQGITTQDRKIKMTENNIVGTDVGSLGWCEEYNQESWDTGRPEILRNYCESQMPCLYNGIAHCPETFSCSYEYSCKASKSGFIDNRVEICNQAAALCRAFGGKFQKRDLCKNVQIYGRKNYC